MKRTLFPDFIFETSWEVCNKVGGIYTVLSTRAKVLQDILGDKLIFIGPDIWKETESPYFVPDHNIYVEWMDKARSEGLNLRVGRWKVPGDPVTILVDFQQYFAVRNGVYGNLWNAFGVDSLHGYGDYDDSAVFSIAVSKVVESFYSFYLSEEDKVVFHANEWQTGFAALLLQQSLPQIASIFTTHATSIGRSIAGKGKPLYEYLWAYNGDQMAQELNVESKHSIEKQTAHYADCFTTVSDITAIECENLLDKPCDVVLPNGFEDDFVPQGASFTRKRSAARRKMLSVANALLGTELDDDTLIVSTSGRYEFRNKGIDVFIEAMNRLNYADNLNKNVLALIEVPAWVGTARQDLIERLQSKQTFDTPLPQPFLTHWLNNMNEDAALGMMRQLGITNAKDSKVKVIFVPCYLTGNDGVFNLSYYDLIIGNNLCAYPSYYEPWGYTPLESIAFKVPCITTDLAGFGLWANKETGKSCELQDGVKVIHRTDYNYHEVADAIKDTVALYAGYNKAMRRKCRNAAVKLSEKALWSKFIKYYRDAYAFALSKAEQRNQSN